MVVPDSIEVARHIYRWQLLSEDGDELDVETYELLEGILQTSMSLEQFHLMGNRLRKSPGQDEIRAEMRERWGGVMDACPSEEEADCFLTEIFESFDHSLLYSHALDTGRTRTGVGTLNDTVTRVEGNMPCWTLHLTISGRALYIGDREVEVKRGDLLLLSPSARCHYLRHPACKQWDHDWVLFQPRAHWARWMEWPELSPGVHSLRIEDPDVFKGLEALAAQMRELLAQGAGIEGDLQYNRLEELLIRAWGELQGTSSVAVDARVTKACDYIRDNLAGVRSVAEVASHCHISPSRLAHLFQQHLGVGPMQWRNDLRMQEARRLLLDSRESIGAIARQVGYEDPTQFSKFFTKHVGTSPRDFRSSFTQAGTAA